MKDRTEAVASSRRVRRRVPDLRPPSTASIMYHQRRSQRPTMQTNMCNNLFSLVAADISCFYSIFKKCFFLDFLFVLIYDPSARTLHGPSNVTENAQKYTSRNLDVT